MMMMIMMMMNYNKANNASASQQRDGNSFDHQIILPDSHAEVCALPTADF